MKLFLRLLLLGVLGVSAGCWQAQAVTFDEDTSAIDPFSMDARFIDLDSDGFMDGLDSEEPEPEPEPDPDPDPNWPDGPSGSQCDNDEDCGPGYKCWNHVCVGEGRLRFSLMWISETDFDLHVVTPDGFEIYYGRPNADGGELDVDDCIGGGCARPGEIHVENIYFQDSPSEGEYQYWVHNYQGTISGEYRLEVYVDGVLVQESSGVLPASDVNSDPIGKYTYTN